MRREDKCFESFIFKLYGGISQAIFDVNIWGELRILVNILVELKIERIFVKTTVM